jgi:chromate reductase, NAD(P)H dehydrogenase (quinone)
MNIRILAVNGSARTGSLNQRILERAIEGAQKAGAEVTLSRLAEFNLPIYDADSEAENGLPQAARELQSLVADHDALLIATPEYNGGYSALLKNAIDWISRPREGGSSGVSLLSGKVAALISASPGQLGGLRSQTGMRAVLDKLGMIVIPDSMALSAAHEAFDAEGKIKDANAEKILQAVGAALYRTALRLA